MVDGKKLMACVAVISLQACFIEAPNSPPACRSKGVAGELGSSLVSRVNGYVDTGDAGWLLPDGGMPAMFLLMLDPRSGGITLPTVILATNVSHSEYQADSLQLNFQAVDPTQPIEFRFTATCSGSAANVVRVTLVPNNDGYDATFADLS